MSKNKSEKMRPDIDQKRAQMLNLRVLQRIDSHVEDILITAPHVSLYQFHYQWSRKDVEGPLFVVKRNTQPRFQFIVMNRRNTENLVEDLLGDFDFDIQVPYLFYSNASQEVNGIWFYNSHECEEVANLFTRILGAYSKVHKKPASSSKSNFDELGAVQTTAVIEGPQEPSLAGPVSASVPTPMNIGHSIDVFPSPLASQALSHPLPPTSALPTQLYDNPDSTNGHNWITDLVKPSTFVTRPSSSPLPTPPFSSLFPMPSLQPHLNISRPHGTELVQPFRPPTPPPYLTPATSTYGPICRDKVHGALLTLVQDTQFIDMVSQALQKMHQS